ncbi:GNAT family N-acetyltransferase [Lysobacter sp. CFH 32150]|uniref:GNAT family N-acetyltransferase n=1 Tax=Lysobacter sp. CFH 32150 TaxID=2927128 RepID=UPI001FA70F6B|nr:GNAT family N-acetyltransferase [Lysobacter sp. CFH 32150]MCI4566497.1 GNAT family N-acetyltransferase [Lysobacter sp. CFH 32150]
MKLSEIQLETDRLTLRVQRAEDFEGFAELLGDEEACRYIGGHMPRAAAWRKFLQMPGAWLIQGFGMFAVIEKASGEWVGNIGPWQPEGWPGTEVGWALRRMAWGKGYALEAATAAIDWSFDNLGWTDVIHSIDHDNQASQLLAQRLGSRNRGPGRLPAPFDEVEVDIWGQTREEWRARRKASA